MFKSKDNQKQSIRDQFVSGAIIGGMEIIEKIPNKTRYKVKCLVCNEILDVHEVTLRRRLEHPEEYGCSKCVRKKYYQTLCSINPGDIVGNYELIKPYNDDRRTNLWVMKCLKCGNERVMSITNARKQQREGCCYCNPLKGQLTPKERAGYNHQFKPQVYTKDERFYKDYSNKIKSLNSRNEQGTRRKYKEWKLTLKEFSDIIHQDCFYCGAKPEYKESYTTKSNPDDKLFANGIDRLDSSIGYTVENCVPCCKICNRMKQDLTQEEFYNHLNKILNYSNKCSTTIPKGSTLQVDGNGNGDSLETENEIV